MVEETSPKIGDTITVLYKGKKREGEVFFVTEDGKFCIECYGGYYIGGLSVDTILPQDAMKLQ